MINLELLKEAVIPVPSIKQQCWITREVDNSLTRDRSLLDTLECQLSLLAERRHALITAAVTGQLDVTTARSGVRP
jgi:type I restriction enzyme S subunit